MASRADQLASNLSLAKFSQATDLKKRLWFTLGALIVFRFLSFVPLPGVGHCPHDEAPQLVNPLLVDFVKRVSGAAAA